MYAELIGNYKKQRIKSLYGNILQMSRVKAISGATGTEIKQLHDQALQLGADTAFSAK